jgi:mono/diheme cytochrome c family protein
MHGNIVVSSFVISVPAPVMVTVPDVVGMDQSGAGAAITAADLAVGSVTFVQSDTVPAGDVISQDPAAGSMAAEGSPVNLVISQGVPQESVSFSSQVQPIFTSSCIACHSPGGVMSHLDLRAGFSYGNLVNELAVHSSGVLVVPGDSAHSVLYLRITGMGLTRMPLGGSLTAQEISLIQTWIDEGANDN